MLLYPRSLSALVLAGLAVAGAGAASRAAGSVPSSPGKAPAGRQPHLPVDGHNIAKPATQGRVVLRRLNRVEYQNTIRDLLGVEVDFKDLLPQDTSAAGFDNVGEALHTSSFLVERYLEAADRALRLAIVDTPQPPVIRKRLLCSNQHEVKTTTERVYLQRDDETVLFSSSPWNAITFWEFYPRDRGRYRFRISAAGVQSGGKAVTFRVDAGPMLMGTTSHLVGYFDAPADRRTVTEFVDTLEPQGTLRILPYGLASAQTVHKIGADQYRGPGLAVQWIDVEGPLYDSWPPESHRRIFGSLAQAPVANARDRMEVVSSDPAGDAERILRSFARRAYRRPVTDADVRPVLALVRQKLADGDSFEQAVRVGLETILVSPDFLFLNERASPVGTKLDGFTLASRLSYFLWSSMPDEELLSLAEKKQLGTPEVLDRQIERMLADPRATAFTTNFVDQWLGLREIDFTEPDRRLYPEFDDMLRAALVKEPHLFFEEVLKHDLSLTNFVSSDFTFLNERLAKHYGIPGVEGHAFRKVTLPPGSHRGGVMTMASVLKVTANGTNTSPVVRGAWVLDRILGTPPSPPPPGVPAIEPDVRGATTMREQLAKHRQVPACASCHVSIDPPGFALESFDVIGGWRDNYRSVGRGEPVSIDGQRMPYAKGPRVDPADQWPDGRRFSGVDELKQLLLANKDQLARALATRLVTYATGGPPRTGDRAEIDALISRVHGKNYGLRTLLHAIVRSRLFLYR